MFQKEKSIECVSWASSQQLELNIYKFYYFFEPLCIAKILFTENLVFK